MLLILEIIAIVLCIVHFAIPLTYYAYMKKYLKNSWNIKINANYRPTITIIIPTYNEAKTIQRKLINIQEQNYPRELIETIIIDSASTDGTPTIIKRLIKIQENQRIKLIQEKERKGKAYALNNALKHATGEIIIVTDADALWPQDALTELVKWLSDPTVGAVSCLKRPIQGEIITIEEGYRKYYNILRIAESKAWSTPIFHGELAAYKKHLLRKIEGFPTDIGADDSYTATRIALLGCRTITPETLWCYEMIPKKGYHTWRIRRAQHLIQHFTKTLKIKPSANPAFKKILAVEAYLHIMNPWLLIAATLILMISIIYTRNILPAMFLVTGLILLLFKPFRTWIATQLYLTLAMIRNLWTKDLMWRKQLKT